MDNRKDKQYRGKPTERRSFDRKDSRTTASARALAAATTAALTARAIAAKTTAAATAPQPPAGKRRLPRPSAVRPAATWSPA